MPGYKAHISGYLLIIGILSLLAIISSKISFPEETFFTGVIIGATYSILPDIDTPSSKMRKIVGKLFLGISLACLITFLFLRRMELIYPPLVLILFLYILWFSRHRRTFHTPLIGILFSIPLYLINTYYVFFALLGFFSHLVLDNKIFK